MSRTHNTVAILLAFVALSTFSDLSYPEEKTNYEFLSWYNGWGSHHVQGVGSITGSYTNALVKCDENKIKVVPIYDTHSAIQPPDQKQSATFAKAHNVALVKELAKKDIHCVFEKEPPTE